MTVKQIFDLVNKAVNESVGETTVLNEDLSNVVDVGKAIFEADAVDNYVKSLVDHIGKVIFVNRKYAGNAPSVLMDAWEYGSVVEKIQCDLPKARENQSWKLEDGTDYSQDIFYKPSISVKFFNSKTTFECDVSFTDIQVKESFDSPAQLNAFVSMIYTMIENRFTIDLDNLILRTIDNFIAITFKNDMPDGQYGNKSTTKAVNLLKLYNIGRTEAQTAEAALKDPEFIRFASYTMGLYVKRMASASELFNIGKKVRFTPAERLHVVMLNDFATASNVYLQSDTYHNEFTKLPEENRDIVNYWQGSGQDYGFGEVSEIHVTANDGTGIGAEVTATGILAVMFDREALGVTNLDKRVKSHYNNKAEFWTNFHKLDAGFFNDPDENFVVFYIADAAA